MGTAGIPGVGRTRVAVVTGASAGVGAAIAEAFADQRWAVAVGARRIDRLDALGERIRSRGGAVLVHALDVTDIASVDAFCTAVEEKLGPVDLLVNNAAVVVPGRLGTAEPADLRTVVETNLLGSLFMTNRLVGPMVENGLDGDIVFVTSDAGVTPWPSVLSYGTTKAGLENLAVGLRIELEDTAVRVSVLRIGQTSTEMTSSWPEDLTLELFEDWQRKGVLRAFGLMDPADVARAAVHIARLPPALKIDVLEVRAAAAAACTEAVTEVVGGVGRT